VSERINKNLTARNTLIHLLLVHWPRQPQWTASQTDR